MGERDLELGTPEGDGPGILSALAEWSERYEEAHL